MSSAQAFPESGTTIPSNANLLITLYGTARDKLSKAPNQSYYFMTDGHRIEAKVVRTLNSEFGLTAVYLQTTMPLAVDSTYSLAIAGQQYEWKVTEADTSKPTWTTPPSLVEFKKVRYGCGPSKNYEISLDLRDDSPVFYEVALTDKKKQRFYVLERELRTLKIGHGMCSGAFTFASAKPITAHITPYDLGGNRGDTKTVLLTR